MRLALSFNFLALLVGCNSILGVDDPKARPDSGAPLEEGPECTKNAQCLAKTDEFNPSACVNGSCVKLLSDSCPFLLPATERGWLKSLRGADVEPVIFGVFGLVGEFPPLQAPDSRNFDLAFTEVLQAAGGIPAAGDKRRPVLALVCRNQYDTTEDFDAAIDHLIDEVRVPGIIPVLAPADLLHVFARSGHDRHVFFMSPFGAEEPLLDITDDSLIWAELPGGAALAPTYGPLLDLTVEHLRSTGALGDTAPVRVALVRADDDVALAAMGSSITQLIHFNGKSAQANTPDYFRSFSVPSADLARDLPDYSAAMTALIDFAPHIVISSARNEFLSAFLPALEAKLAEPPTYLLSPINYLSSSLWDVLAPCDPSDSSCHGDLRTRLIGVNYAGAADKTNYAAYQARSGAAYPGYPALTEYENAYDAAYHLIYAAAAAGPVSPLSGADLTLGMRRLLGGPPFNVGPEELPPAYRALQTPGSSITLNGAMGPPDFDPALGARATPGTVWCIDESYTRRTDVLRLNAAGQLTGEFPCFAFP